jgi:integrase
VTVQGLCEEHLQYQLDNGELKPTSADRRRTTINRHIGDYPIGNYNAGTLHSADITDHVNTLLNDAQLSSSSVIKVIDVLFAAYQWAVSREHCQYNPVISVRDTLKKKVMRRTGKCARDRDVVYLSEDEESKFILEAGKVDDSTGKLVHDIGQYALLLLYTGMRVGELIALRWCDYIKDAKPYMTIDKNRVVASTRDNKGKNRFRPIEGTTKNMKARTIFLSPDAVETLTAIYSNSNHAKAEDYICRINGKPLTATIMDRKIKNIYREAGLGEYSGCHVLRRTFASRQYANGGLPKEISEYIGNLPTTTEKYYIGVRRKIVKGDKALYIVEVPHEKKDET